MSFKLLQRALSSYKIYLYMVFIQHFFHLEQNCFHLYRQFSCSSNISNWFSWIPTQSNPVIQNSCYSWLSCTLSMYQTWWWLRASGSVVCCRNFHQCILLVSSMSYSSLVILCVSFLLLSCHSQLHCIFSVSSLSHFVIFVITFLFFYRLMQDRLSVLQ